MTAVERFWSKIDKAGPVPAARPDLGPCWIFSGTNGDGYGQFQADEEHHYAHRFSYELHKGPIPRGLTLDHLCVTRSCANPDHLEAVPQGVNTLRGSSASGLNSRKTHCKRGHEFTPTNTYERLREGKFLYRTCRRCEKEKGPLRRRPSVCRV